MKRTLKLIPGLPRERLFEEIYRHHRDSDASRRALGFYLLDMQRRYEQKAKGYSHALLFAVKDLKLSKREAREILRVARGLEELPEIDRAFGRGEIVWSRRPLLAFSRSAPSANCRRRCPPTSGERSSASSSGARSGAVLSSAPTGSLTALRSTHVGTTVTGIRVLPRGRRNTESAVAAVRCGRRGSRASSVRRGWLRASTSRPGQPGSAASPWGISS